MENLIILFPAYNYQCSVCNFFPDANSLAELIFSLPVGYFPDIFIQNNHIPSPYTCQTKQHKFL